MAEFRKDALLAIRWGSGGKPTRVEWRFRPQDDGTTFVEITEEGYGGTNEEIIAQAIDSTGGFNQVIVAAKALVEHGVEINPVKDHTP